MLPPDMADWLPQDHLVWFVLEVVEQLDTTVFHADRRLGGRGREAYDPDMLLALLVYAYATGERSSRRIERLCTEHVAFRVLCAQDGPDHSTLARFRARHQEGFKGFFAQVLRLCADAGMVKVGVVSIDGTKIAANAAKARNRSPEWVREQATKIAEDVVHDAAATDAAEDTEAAARGTDGDDGLPPGFATRQGRAANIRRAAEELARRDAQHAEADAADRASAREFLDRVESEGVAGPTPAGVCPVEHQQARLRRWQGIVADLEGEPGADASRVRRQARTKIKLTQKALAEAEANLAAGEVDLRGLSARERDRRAARARQRGGIGDPINVTDPDSRLMTEGAGGGSVQGYNAQLAVTDDHLILGVHVSQHANDTNCFTPTLGEASAQAGRLDKRISLVLLDNGYFTEHNLTAAGPDRLIATGKNHEVHAAARANPTTGAPPPGAGPLEAMRHRMRQPGNVQQYKRRSATSEPVNAHLKDQIGLRRFARRGLAAVTAELHLAAACINLNRLHQAGQTTD